MIILSHRGYWKKENEKNTIEAFVRSADLGFGTETDIRDLNLDVIISHDMPSSNETKLVSLSNCFDIFKVDNLKLALNVKSDGLQKEVFKLIQEKKIENYFLFDMSIPDTIGYLNLGLNVFCRQSEFEKEVPFYNQIMGIWLDSFEDIWYNYETINEHILNGKFVCIVSSELHKRDHISHWELLKSWGIHKSSQVILCTDLPENAKSFFN
jgi:hypothetical protein